MKHEKGATRGWGHERVLPGREKGVSYFFAVFTRKKNAEYSALLETPGMDET
jgi:hypothetical protein